MHTLKYTFILLTWVGMTSYTPTFTMHNTKRKLSEEVLLQSKKPNTLALVKEFSIAVFSNNYTEVRQIVEQDPHVLNSYLTDTTCTALHLSVLFNNQELLQFLLELAPSNTCIIDKDICNNTLLMSACLKGNLSIIKQLVEAEKQYFSRLTTYPTYNHPDLQNNLGNTVLHCALESNNNQIVKFITEQGYYTTKKNRANLSPLALAKITNSSKESIELLEQNDLNYNFLQATRLKSLAEIQRLLKKGANPTSTDFLKKTALMKAAERPDNKDNLSIVLFLCSELLNHEARDLLGNTALHIAAQNNISITMHLLCFYIRFAIKNNAGKTASDCITRNNYTHGMVTTFNHLEQFSIQKNKLEYLLQDKKIFDKNFGNYALQHLVNYAGEHTQELFKLYAFFIKNNKKNLLEEYLLLEPVKDFYEYQRLVSRLCLAHKNDAVVFLEQLYWLIRTGYYADSMLMQKFKEKNKHNYDDKNIKKVIVAWDDITMHKALVNFRDSKNITFKYT